MRKLCKAQTKRGTACPQPALDSAGFCFFHSPEFAQARAEARRQGGIARGQVLHLESLQPLRSPKDILRRCEELYLKLVSGELSPRLIVAACKLLEQARESYELLLLESRLRRALSMLEGNSNLPYLSSGGDSDGEQAIASAC